MSPRNILPILLQFQKTTDTVISRKRILTTITRLIRLNFLYFLKKVRKQAPSFFFRKRFFLEDRHQPFRLMNLFIRLKHLWNRFIFIIHERTQEIKKIQFSGRNIFFNEQYSVRDCPSWLFAHVTLSRHLSQITSHIANFFITYIWLTINQLKQWQNKKTIKLKSLRTIRIVQYA